MKMKNKLPQRDPIGAYQRKVTRARRVGVGAQCACGEARPEALVKGSNPIICAKCQRESRGQKTMDEHHVAGEANGSITMDVPVNDHRAELSAAQYDWPKETRENPDGSPVLAAAAHIRGFVDKIVYLVKNMLLWIPEMLESLHALLVEKFGPKWWLGTPLEPFAPKR